jgi:hypothetical protein
VELLAEYSMQARVFLAMVSVASISQIIVLIKSLLETSSTLASLELTYCFSTSPPPNFQPTHAINSTSLSPFDEKFPSFPIKDILNFPLSKAFKCFHALKNTVAFKAATK